MACLMDQDAVEAWVSAWRAVKLREFTRANPAPIVADAPVHHSGQSPTSRSASRGGAIGASGTAAGLLA